MPTLERQDDVFILDIGDGENRFHPDWVAAVHGALDEVEQADGPRALVTAATGKFFSNGLDLDWLLANTDRTKEYVASVQSIFARVLTLPVTTVAALQGHTFAAGAMLSLAHDFRVMRADRGFWCLPEVDIQIPFTAGMSALIQARLTPQTAHEAMTTGRRYGGAGRARRGHRRPCRRRGEPAPYRRRDRPVPRGQGRPDDGHHQDPHVRPRPRGARPQRRLPVGRRRGAGRPIRTPARRRPGDLDASAGSRR